LLNLALYDVFHKFSQLQKNLNSKALLLTSFSYFYFFLNKNFKSKINLLIARELMHLENVSQDFLKFPEAS